MLIPHKVFIIVALSAIMWSPSWAYAQSDRIHNTSTRGLTSMRTGTGRAYAPAAQFGQYASGITYSAPPRTTGNPLSGGSGFQTSRSAPSRDFRISSGRMDTRSLSTRLSGNGRSLSQYSNPANSRNMQRLALPVRHRPMQTIRSTASPFASLSSQAFDPRKKASQSAYRNPRLSRDRTKGLSAQKPMSQSKGLTERKSSLPTPLNPK